MHLLANIVRIALLALLLITPWLFGGVWARVQWVLMLVAAILLAIDLATRFGEDDRPNLVPTAWLPVLAGIALGLFQLVPWSPTIAMTMAPATVQWRTELTGTSDDPSVAAAPSAEGDLDAATPVQSAAAGAVPRIARSMYVVATREYLALLTLALAVFVLASIYFVDRQTVFWFFLTFAFCGAAMSFFGLVQRLSWNGKFYWVFEPLAGGFQSFGPFVNRNNAGGFLNLCLAAGLGLLVWVHRIPGSESSDSRSSRRLRRDTGHRSGSSRRHGTRSSRSQEREVEAKPAEATPIAETPPVVDIDPSTSEATTEVRESDEVPNASSTPSDVSAGGDTEETLDAAYRRSRQQRSTGSHGQRDRADGPHEGYSSGSYPVSYESSGNRLSEPRTRSLRELISDYVGDLNARKLGALALVTFTAGGVLCTASRGSIVALFTAAMVTSAVLAVRRGSRGYAVALLVILIAGVALMNWGGQTDFVRSRFESMFDEAQYERGRLPNWREALRVVPHFPLLGSGLGTYAFVYERYQQRFLGNIIHLHAENQFIQSLVDGGVVALVLLIMAIVLTAVAIVRLYRTGGLVNNSLAITGTFGLISQFVGGMFDFGTYIPSNMMLMAALFGIVIGRAALLTVWPSLDKIDQPKRASGYQAPSTNRPSASVVHRHLPDERKTVAGETRSRRDYSRRRASTEPKGSYLLGLPAPSVIVTFLVGFLMIGSLFGSLEMNRAARIESAVRQANLPRLIKTNLPEDMALVANPLAAAIPLRWDDALAHQHLALLYLSRYQSETYHRLVAQRVIEEAVDPESATDGIADPAAADEPVSLDDELWRRASIQHLHRTLSQMHRSGNSIAAAQLVNSDPVQRLLIPAVRHLVAARQFAPTISRVHYRLAELTPVDSSLSDGRVHLQRAQLLSPGDATLWYWSGVLELNSGQTEEACKSFRRSLELSRLHVDEIMFASKGQLTVRQLLDKALPDQADLLLFVAKRHFAGADLAKYRNVFLARAEQASEEMDLSPAETAYTHAAILSLQDRKDEAIPFFEDAISRDSNNRNWRYEYALMLMDLKRYDKAEKHVMYLILARPKYRPYTRLNKRFNSKRYWAGTPDDP